MEREQCADGQCNLSQQSVANIWCLLEKSRHSSNLIEQQKVLRPVICYYGSRPLLLGIEIPERGIANWLLHTKNISFVFRQKQSTIPLPKKDKKFQPLNSIPFCPE